MTESKTLFLQFDSSNWTEEELNDVMDAMNQYLPDNIDVVALADSIEFMDQEDLDGLIETLIEISEGGE